MKCSIADELDSENSQRQGSLNYSISIRSNSDSDESPQNSENRTTVYTIGRANQAFIDDVLSAIEPDYITSPYGQPVFRNNPLLGMEPDYGPQRPGPVVFNVRELHVHQNMNNQMEDDDQSVHYQNQSHQNRSQHRHHRNHNRSRQNRHHQNQSSQDRPDQDQVSYNRSAQNQSRRNRPHQDERNQRSARLRLSTEFAPDYDENDDPLYADIETLVAMENIPATAPVYDISATNRTNGRHETPDGNENSSFISTRLFDQSERCCICLEVYYNQPPDTVIVALRSCDHIFHHECITSWLQSNNDFKCPLCNVEGGVSSTWENFISGTVRDLRFRDTNDGQNPPRRDDERWESRTYNVRQITLYDSGMCLICGVSFHGQPPGLLVISGRVCTHRFHLQCVENIIDNDNEFECPQCYIQQDYTMTSVSAMLNRF